MAGWLVLQSAVAESFLFRIILGSHSWLGGFAVGCMACPAGVSVAESLPFRIILGIFKMSNGRMCSHSSLCCFEVGCIACPAGVSLAESFPSSHVQSFMAVWF